MKSKYFIYLLIAVLLLVGLSIVNLWLSVHNAREVDTKIQRALSQPPTEGAQGPIGPVGVSGVDGLSIPGSQGATGEQGTSGPDGKDGAEGSKGDTGQPGIPGREIELTRDLESGDIMWRYTGDDFWTILVSGCEIKVCVP